MQRSQLKHGDLLIAIVGATIGSAGIYDRHEPANINQAIAAVRLSGSDVSREFACWYLHSSLGQRLPDFFKRPVARANINLEEVGEIPLLVPHETKQHELVAAMDVARTARRAKLAEADALLAGLDGFLLQTLGLTPSPKDDRKAFAARRADVPARFDPHFHLPALAQNTRMLTAGGAEPLGSLVSFSDEIWKPAKHEKPTFRYIEISNVNPNTGEARAEEVPVAEAPSRARVAVRTNDIILSLTRPDHGSIAQIPPELDGCVASTGFSVLRDIHESRLNREYLWCVLRSKMCLLQMLQRASGGNYPAITEPELAKVLLPVPKPAVQETIAAEARRRRDVADRARERDGSRSRRPACNWFVTPWAHPESSAPEIVLADAQAPQQRSDIAVMESDAVSELDDLQNAFPRPSAVRVAVRRRSIHECALQVGFLALREAG